jgi:hypothetical protein
MHSVVVLYVELGAKFFLVLLFPPLGDKLAPTRFVLSGSRHRYLKSAKTSPPIQNEDYRPASPLSFSPLPLGLITSRSFLLLSALPLASNGGFTIMAKRKATAEELRAQTVTRGEPTESKIALETSRSNDGTKKQQKKMSNRHHVRVSVFLA